MKINCSTEAAVKLSDLTPFQGNLKNRTRNDLKALCESLKVEGLMMPFAVWIHDDKKYILDGHGRYEALINLSLEDPSLLTMDWPCIYIKADDENAARKSLLQITSQYGKITKQGVKQFMVSIPDYKAPAVLKYVVPKKASEKAGSDLKQFKSNKTILKISVDNDKVMQVREILKQFDFIEVK